MKKKINWILLLGFTSAVAALACGPFFPNAFLNGGTGYLFRAPFALFHKEIAQLFEGPQRPTAVNPEGFQTPQSQSVDKELEDLSAALESMPVSREKKQQLYADYKDARSRLAVLREKKDGLSGGLRNMPIDRWAIPLPTGLPEEFRLYFNAALAYHNGRLEEAEQGWIELLKLPASDRHYKSVWAAFMLGRMAEGDKSLEYMHSTRTLAAEGFSDSLGLAASSYGWEARTLLHLDRPVEALELYLQQYQTGDYSAYASVQSVLRGFVRETDRDRLGLLAAKEPLRRLFTSYLISNHYPNNLMEIEQVIDVWLQTLHARSESDPQLATGLALAAYHIGDLKKTQDWLKVANPESPAVYWIQAKLNLRMGNTEQAANFYRKLVSFLEIEKAAPTDRAGALYLDDHDFGFSSATPFGQAEAEFGVLKMSTKDYADALNLFLSSGYWYDAAYVAEKILTMNELKAHLDLHWPHPAPEPELPQWISNGLMSSSRPHKAMLIRYLLGRRLVREKRYLEAVDYLPSAFRHLAVKLSRLLSVSMDPDTSDKTKAECLWEAARLVRYNGLELMGTEVQPDFRLHQGNFQYGVDIDLRYRPDDWPMVSPTLDEYFRSLESVPEPDIRFHYRHVAADMAWEAADLMPDQSDETARVLCMAGSWLKNTHPEKADRFYKSLVIRCRNTAIGQKADELRWFPQLDAQGDLLQPEQGKAPLPAPFEIPVPVDDPASIDLNML